jgi:predicted nucleotidyltransferase component of viral defense system
MMAACAWGGEEDIMAKNVGESMVAKLRNHAKENKVDVQFLLNVFVLQRFLYRLSLSDWKDSFCLKGGLLIPVWNRGDMFRPTTDIDLNGFDPDGDVETIEKMIRDVVSIVPDIDDGVAFDISRLKIAKAREGAVPGGKIEFDATVHTSRVRVRADVGFGNAITPDVVHGEYPSLLDLPKPNISFYPPETTLAEKLHAMVQHGIYNTRFKDYYDIFLLKQIMDFDPGVLGDAVHRTFERQGTILPEDPEGLSEEFIKEHTKDWTRWVASNKLSVTPPDLAAVVADLREFLTPVISDAREKLYGTDNTLRR